MKQKLVKTWMIRNVITVTLQTPILEARRLMATHHIDHLPVMEGERLIGIVSRDDICAANISAATALDIWQLNYLLGKIKIKAAVTLNPITIGANAAIDEAAHLMQENGISGLPVVKANRKLVGIITKSDIFWVRVVEMVQRNSLFRQTLRLKFSSAKKFIDAANDKDGYPHQMLSKNSTSCR